MKSSMKDVHQLVQNSIMEWRKLKWENFINVHYNEFCDFDTRRKVCRSMAAYVCEVVLENDVKET